MSKFFKVSKDGVAIGVYDSVGQADIIARNASAALTDTNKSVVHDVSRLDVGEKLHAGDGVMIERLSDDGFWRGDGTWD